MNMLPDDQSSGLSKPLCGQLSKYTNVMKGWQYRWFVLNPAHATIEYYEREEYVKQKPRGGIILRGAMIAPSDEDSVTFTIHAVNGEIYRLRADNTKIRQLWVSRLMYVAQTSSSRRGSTASAGNSTWYDQSSRQTKTPTPSLSGMEDNPALVEVKEYVQEMYTLEEQLVDKVDSLPLQGEHINALDQDMLLLKACSRATLCCLENCVSILERQHAAAARNSFNKNHLQSGAKVEWILNVKGRGEDGGKSVAEFSLANSLEESTKKLAAQGQVGFTQSIPVPAIKQEDEVVDTDVTEEQDLGEIEKHKTVILHLLSQLKLGMDLTRVVLPTFILEKRSLLEMFADCMAHPDKFIKVAESSTPESRMIHVVEWYLTSFHEGRKGSRAKKPYNPIIGETFHCSWDVSDERQGGQVNQLIYTAEQVSHHPPVSAFHVTCPQKQISMTGSLWTKSKFMGMSIGVTLVGSLRLFLPQYNEEYVMSLPSAYARSILTYPWVELGDKCNITCRTTGYSASIVFHTKPFYGGKLHRVSGEVKNSEGATCTKISGAWNGAMELTSMAGVKLVDTQSLPAHKKRVRPISKQGDHESRRLWQHVTNALRHNDINTATDHKSLLENRQREEERHRKEKGLSFPTKKRLMKELAGLQSNPPSGICLNEKTSDLMNEWIIDLKGASSTLFEGENYQLRFKFTGKYPFDSPQVTFIGSNIPCHPHIYSNGHICLSILTDDWSPALTVESVCLSIISMLSSCKEKKRPPDDHLYVSRAGSNPKKTRWWYHDDDV